MKTKQILITLLMCCVSISMSAETWTDANGTVWNFSTNGSNATIEAGVSGTIPNDLVIPSTVYVGETAYTVTSIGYQAFYGCSGLTSINIPDGVTSIGYQAFYGCSSLTSINIPEGVTSIGSWAFYGCSSLTSINIPDDVTSIEQYTFYNCPSLTSINIPESVESIGSYAFGGCYGIRSLYIKDIKKYLQISFGNDSSPLCYTTNTVELYVNNVPVTTVIIPEGVTNIPSYAFKNCSNLTSINIPEGVTSIGENAFNNCSSLTSINIPDGVTSIEKYTFGACLKLTSIKIPDGVTSIGNNAFNNCSSLTSINIPDGVTNIGQYAFDNCSSLTSINIPDGVTSIGQGAFNRVNCYMYCENATSCTIGSNAVPLTCTIFVPDEAVEDYRAAWTSYSDIIVGNSFNDFVDVTVEALPSTSALRAKIIEAVSEDEGEDEEKLRSVVKLKVSGTINSYDMMIIRNKMTNLREVDLEHATIVANDYEYYQGYHSEDNVFGGSFLRDTKIRYVVMPTVTSIGNYAFYNCNNLRSVSNLDGVTSIGTNAFYGCNSLSSIDLPSSLSAIGNSAFYNCSSLTSIIIPEGVTTINVGTFYGCI